MFSCSLRPGQSLFASNKHYPEAAYNQLSLIRVPFPRWYCQYSHWFCRQMVSSLNSTMRKRYRVQNVRVCPWRQGTQNLLLCLFLLWKKLLLSTQIFCPINITEKNNISSPTPIPYAHLRPRPRDRISKTWGPFANCSARMRPGHTLIHFWRVDYSTSTLWQVCFQYCHALCVKIFVLNIHKQCRHWSHAAFCGTWSGSTMFVNVFHWMLDINRSIKCTKKKKRVNKVE